VSELREILDTLIDGARRGEASAIGTVVATRGSVYRRAGARLLVPSSGEPIGNISGGCLEGDVARIGREVIASGEPRVAAFDLSADDDAVWGYGLGCNGAIEVFIEPAASAVATAEQIRDALDEQRAICHVLVLTGADAGTHELRANDAAAGALEAGTPRVVDEGGARVFYEPILPPQRLVICAAGHDAIPLVRQAAELGWRVTVADVRRTLLTAERFPGATDFCGADPAAAATAVNADERTAVVLMSHNYLRDIAYLGAFLDAPLRYLGVLGPRGRTRQMLAEMGREDAISRLHAPAGLDIGAEGPEEVARAIVAEILAVTHGRTGGPLRERPGPIHPPT